MLGGKAAGPHWSLRKADNKGVMVSLEFTPPPKLTDLKKGDYVDLTVDYDILPQQGDMYFGYNTIMREQLARADKLYSTQAKGSSRIKTHFPTLKDEVRVASRSIPPPWGSI